MAKDNTPAPICVANPYPNEPKYQPSLIGTCLFTESDGSHKFHSDLHLLLRDKGFAARVGPDALRNYVDSILKDATDSPTSDLTDDQIMESVVSRRITDATDIYQFTKRMQDNIDDFRKQYKEYKEQRKRDNEIRDKLTNFDKS